MKKNVGTTDKIVRFILAALLIALSVTHTITGHWATILTWSVSAVLMITALDGTCPLYAFLRIHTSRTDQNAQ